MGILINIKQSLMNIVSSWGLGGDFGFLAPTNGLAQKVDTSLGVTAQYEDIHEILGDLGRTIDMVEMINYKGMIWDDHVRALKKLGPTVINLKGRNYDYVPKPLDMESLPAVVFLAKEIQELNIEWIKRGAVVPVFMYGIKVDDKHVEKDPDAVTYLVGEYYRWKKGGYWSAFFVVIKDGFIRCAPKYRGRRQEWLEYFAKNHGYTYEHGMKVSAKMCSLYFDLWQRRKYFWRFAAHTPHARVSFLINQADPKRIFADRKVKALTPTGQKKKIIHYVSGHNRTVKGKVVWIKPHLRGLRNFYFGGAYCSVLAPEFHAINADTFMAAAVDDYTEKDGLSIDEFAEILAQGENSQSIEQMRKKWKRQKGKVYRKIRRQQLRDKMKTQGGQHAVGS